MRVNSISAKAELSTIIFFPSPFLISGRKTFVVFVMLRMLSSIVWPKEGENSAMLETMGMVVGVSWAVVISIMSAF